MTESATQNALRQSIDRFDQWLEKAGCDSYDPYDIWGTKYGVQSRGIYYENGLLGLPLIAPILLMEILCPGLRRLFVKKKRYPTADAQLVLAFLNLFSITGDSRFLEKAKEIARGLMESSVPGFSGHCWGYPFDWRSNSGLWKKNTPFITATPYCFEAFLGLFDATQDAEYLSVAQSAAEFIYTDIRDTDTGEGASAGSYSPADNSKVFNASAYRAFALTEAAARWNLEHYRQKAAKNLNFILRGQRPDGAWWYSIDNPAETFIDHFHTCFVLKNLFKVNRHLRESPITAAIQKGFDYYRSALFTADGQPKSFSVVPRTQLARLEMYNFAEGITLGALLRNEVSGAGDLAKRLAKEVVEKHQVPKGYFVTRVFVGGLRHTVPFLRWPQSQLFYALTNLWKANETDAPMLTGPSREQTSASRN